MGLWSFVKDSYNEGKELADLPKEERARREAERKAERKAKRDAIHVEYDAERESKRAKYDAERESKRAATEERKKREAEARLERIREQLLPDEEIEGIFKGTLSSPDTVVTSKRLVQVRKTEVTNTFLYDHISEIKVYSVFRTDGDVRMTVGGEKVELKFKDRATAQGAHDLIVSHLLAR